MELTVFAVVMLALSALIVLAGAGVVWVSLGKRKTRQFFDLETGETPAERRHKISINDEVDIRVDHVEGDHVIVEVDAPGRVHIDCREEDEPRDDHLPSGPATTKVKRESLPQ